MKPLSRLAAATPALGAALAASLALAGARAGAVYIPTGDGGAVVVVDPATNAPVGRIDGLPAAHGLAVTPDGARLVVGSLAERDPGAALPPKPAGMSEAGHAAHHAGRGQGGGAPQGAVSTVSVVDTATGAILRRIDVPGAVHHVAIDPAARFAAVTHPGGGGISVIDLGALALVATVPTGAVPNYAAFSADGAELYVSNAADDSIAVLDTGSWTVAATIPVGTGPEHIALAPDGTRLAVNGVAAGTVTLIDLATRRVAATWPVGDTPHGIDFSDDGTTVYVALRGEDRLVALDLAEGSVRSAPLAPEPYHLKVLRGRGLLYVSSAGASKIWAVDAATLAPVAAFDLPGTGHQFGAAGS